MAKKTKAELQAELTKGKSIADVAAEQENANVAPASEQTQVAPEAPKEEKKKAPGKIAQILEHFKAGKTNKEIAQLFVKDENGNDTTETFHPTTISIQVSKYKLAHPDLYPPQPPAPTKAQLKAEAKAKKEAEEAAAKAEKEAAASAGAVAQA